MILTRILDVIMDHRGEFDILDFKVGRKKEDYSYARVEVIGGDREHLDLMVSDLIRYGATIPETSEVSYMRAPMDRVLPEEFYCTTHHPTQVYLGGGWIDVEGVMMDKHIIVDPDHSRAYCKPIREVLKGDLVVTEGEGIRVIPPERPREGVGVFEFMNSEVSSERPSLMIVKQIAEDLHKTRSEGGKIVVVAGPAVIHTGAGDSLARMIEQGYVDALLSGNALAVHDIEHALYGTSLGVHLGEKRTVQPRNHIAAINQVYAAGSIEKLVRSGKLTRGILYQLESTGTPYVLAGSIRDDGPLPEVIRCSDKAQEQYKRHIEGASMVLMFSSALHSIAVGNMLRSDVKIVCVDINPAVVTKLSDRGTSQAIGIVSDVGTILPLLMKELDNKGNRSEA